jgi:hypothetical protein
MAPLNYVGKCAVVVVLALVATGCGGGSDDDEPSAGTVGTETVATIDPAIRERVEKVLSCAKKIDAIDADYTSDWDAESGVVFTPPELRGSMVLLVYRDEEAATARLEDMHSFYDNVQVHREEVIARQGDFDPDALAAITNCL